MQVPKTIGGATVVSFALSNHLLPANTEQKRAYGMAICNYESGNGYYLFFCDDNWNEFADIWHETIEDAKDQAEYDYPGISSHWM